jgi:hypothetical protein
VLTRWLLMTFGDGDEHYAQAHLAALSLLAYAPEPREIVLATDRPQRFAWLSQAPGVRVAALDAATLERWKGAHGFFWRIKIELIRSHLAEGAALAYVDSDTIARRDLAPLVAALAGGAAMMHEREQPLAGSRRRGDRALWRGLGGRTFAGLAVDEAATMWNAGVVAVGPEGAPLIAHALEACDAFCAAIGTHSLNEQFAISLSLSSSGRLQAAREWIDHYWGNKPDHLVAIGRLLGRALGDGLDPLAAAALVRARPIQLPLHVKRPWWKKALARKLGVAPP